MMEPDRKRMPEEREACFRSRRFRARRERCGAVAETPHFTKKVPGVYCAQVLPGPRRMGSRQECYRQPHRES
jgi:hypothetical protein